MENDNPKMMKPVPPFVKFVCANVPMVFDDSLSYYEALSALWKYVSDMTDVINNNALLEEEFIVKFNELKEYVENYFDNLDVQDEINAKLDAMAEDGTLQAMVETYLAPYTEQIQNNTNAIEKLGNKNTPEYIYTRIIKTTDVSGDFDAHICKEQEGIVITGQDKIVTFYSPTTIAQNDTILFEEIDYSTPYSPTIVRSGNITGLMHCNSACYNPTTGKILVALAQYNDPDDGHIIYVNKLAIITYSNMTLDSIVTISGVTEFTKVAYDEDEDKYYIFGENAVWELDYATFGVTKLFDVDTSVIQGTQGLNVRKGYIYLQLAYPRSIVKMDMEGNIVSIVNIDDFDNEGHIFDYVADFAFIDDDNVLITPHASIEYLNKTIWRTSYYANYLCKLNLKGSNFGEPTFDGLIQQQRLYVNTANAQDTITFENGSETYPYSLLGSYIRNKYGTLYHYRCTELDDTKCKYYGSLLLNNFNLYINKPLEFDSCVIINSSIQASSITALSATEHIEIQGSNISCKDFKITYNEASPLNIIASSNINVTRLIDGSNTYTTKLQTRGSRFNKYLNTFKTIGSMPNQFLAATITKSGTTLTADFTDYIGTLSAAADFWPNNYLLAIRVTNPDETLVYIRTQGFGDNRIVYDHAGNTYTVKLYNQNNKTIEITSSNITNVTGVTMVVL